MLFFEKLLLKKRLFAVGLTMSNVKATPNDMD